MNRLIRQFFINVGWLLWVSTSVTALFLAGGFAVAEPHRPVLAAVLFLIAICSTALMMVVITNE